MQKNPKQIFNKLNPAIKKKETKRQANLQECKVDLTFLNQGINVIHYFNRKKRKKSHDHHNRLLKSI